ncbi:MAG: hypothetical protein Q4G40_06775 [Brachybacterium sp.]|nr:hypothetical protein [Brachybacterium sp.]
MTTSSDIPPTAQPVPGTPAPMPFPPHGAPVDARHFPTSAGNDGRIAWALGLLGLIGFPGAAAICMGASMLIVGLLQGKKNPVARAIGRRAALFGAITLATVVVFFSAVVTGVNLNPSMDSPLSIALMIVLIPTGGWMIIVGPLVGLICGIVALARPVPRDRAARILARDAA